MLIVFFTFDECLLTENTTTMKFNMNPMKRTEMFN